MTFIYYSLRREGVVVYCIYYYSYYYSYSYYYYFYFYYII